MAALAATLPYVNSMAEALVLADAYFTQYPPSAGGAVQYMAYVRTHTGHYALQYFLRGNWNAGTGEWSGYNYPPYSGSAAAGGGSPMPPATPQLPSYGQSAPWAGPPPTVQPTPPSEGEVIPPSAPPLSAPPPFGEPPPFAEPPYGGFSPIGAVTAGGVVTPISRIRPSPRPGLPVAVAPIASTPRASVAIGHAGLATPIDTEFPGHAPAITQPISTSNRSVFLADVIAAGPFGNSTLGELGVVPWATHVSELPIETVPIEPMTPEEQKIFDSLPKDVQDFLKDKGMPSGMRANQKDKTFYFFLIWLIFTNGRGSGLNNQIPMGNVPMGRVKGNYELYDPTILQRWECGKYKTYYLRTTDYIHIPFFTRDERDSICCYHEYTGDPPPDFSRDELRRKQQCGEMMEEELKFYIEHGKGLRWDEEALKDLIEKAFSDWGFSRDTLVAFVESRTPHVTCEPDCKRRIKLDRWQLKVRVHEPIPEPRVWTKCDYPVEKKWTFRPDHGAPVDKTYDDRYCCEWANLFVVISVDYEVAFTLECVK